jgi:DNA-binding response OmpR family regulator
METDTRTDSAILVVDDEPAVLSYVEQALDIEGYRVLTARDGTEALTILESEPVDLILADIEMPHMNGYQLYSRVIENPQWVAIPFVFLSGRSLESDVRYGKELGVDDYLTKPFEVADLLATVHGKLRRAQQMARLSAPSVRQPASGSRALTLGRLRVDLDQYSVSLNGEQARLSAREFELLACLARQANRVVPLQELIQVTHGLETDSVEAGALLRPLIRSLRRKLGYRPGDMGCIQNVRGVGYRLVPPSDSRRDP